VLHLLSLAAAVLTKIPAQVPEVDVRIDVDADPVAVEMLLAGKVDVALIARRSATGG